MQRMGLVVGGGAGPQLAAIFREALLRLGRVWGIDVEVIECAHRSMSFTEMMDWKYEDFEKAARKDLEEIGAFYRDLKRRGIKCVFRAPVNAEALYAIRRELQSVKVARFELGTRRVLLVRDEAQGFYTNDAWRVEAERVTFASSFTFETLSAIVAFAREEAAIDLRDGYRTWLIYKHHLFANIFCRWAERIGGITEVLQPGSAYARLMTQTPEDEQDLLLVAGNEIADLLHEVILRMTNPNGRETGVARNVFLEESVRGLAEYQTHHGSADEAARRNRVNPLATLRASAVILRDEFGVADVVGTLEDAVVAAVHAGLLGSSLELVGSTAGLTQFVLEHVEARMLGAGGS